MTKNFEINLPAEWEEQAFVQLTWPTAETDWAPYLAEAEECFTHIAEEIKKREPLYIFRGKINDTWARDHAFITTRGPMNKLYLNDFCFNGWGLKFAANHDNQINKHFREEIISTLPLECYEKDESEAKKRAIDALNPFQKFYMDTMYMYQQDIVLEGGAIESDGKGTILTTEDCLMAPNRNAFIIREDAEEMLKRRLGAKRVLWLSNVGLTGDDTDSHIDTLARFCPNDTILHCYEATDKSSQAYGLLSMKSQLEEFRTADGNPYRLIPLPLPHPVVYDDEILPATYANFLIINGAVLVPTYNQPDKDGEALAAIKQAFPDREIVGIDCQVLVRQHGSLHCVTMQYPKNA
ncbi:MAG: agmatine deiminase family protein [Prevotella sp.]|nr:agmatine deiminase family protein [Prevotella sp.]